MSSVSGCRLKGSMLSFSRCWTIVDLVCTNAVIQGEYRDVIGTIHTGRCTKKSVHSGRRHNRMSCLLRA